MKNETKARLVSVFHLLVTLALLYMVLCLYFENGDLKRQLRNDANIIESQQKRLDAWELGTMHGGATR